ncbi:hypothetical protein ACEN88_17200 [Massilia sp. CT11-108]|uniref:hypothetical protein n=1 Tax=Massilia sp. CT11-108 TaxID=3393900 RepID=UPI0039A56D4C
MASMIFDAERAHSTLRVAQALRLKMKMNAVIALFCNAACVLVKLKLLRGKRLGWLLMLLT